MSLFNSGSKGAKFENVGDSITGTIKAPPSERQQTKFGTQNPDFWPDGSPKMQIIVPLMTEQRDPADVHDDGERTLYVASKHLKRAIGDAMRAAGVPDVAVGGTLTVQFVGYDPNSKNPAQPAKLYTANYTPPASGFQAQPGQAAAQQPAAVQQVQQPQAVQQVQQPQAVQQAPAAPQAPAHGLTADQVGKLQQLRAAGIPEDTIATAIQATPQQIAAFDATPF